jgi:hypothetical protein
VLTPEHGEEVGQIADRDANFPSQLLGAHTLRMFVDGLEYAQGVLDRVDRRDLSVLKRHGSPLQV